MQSPTTPSPEPPRHRGPLWWRGLVVAAGWIVLIAGVAMLALPGPGIVTIIVGLGILGREYHWARRLNQHAKEHARKLAERALRKKSKTKH